MLTTGKSELVNIWTGRRRPAKRVNEELMCWCCFIDLQEI